MRKSRLLICLICFIIISSCGSGNNPFVKKKVKSLTTNEFLYQVMDKYYFWREDMPTNVSQNLESETFFRKLLSPLDHWSYITKQDSNTKSKMSAMSEGDANSNYPLFSFVKENGKLYARVNFVDDVFGFRESGIKRGDLIAEINGCSLTEENIDALVNSDIHELKLARIENNQIRKENVNRNVRALRKNKKAVNRYRIIESEGRKVGYLAYMNFNQQQEADLLEAFRVFRTAQVDELVLDFRYNPGGAVSTAVKMAGLIAPKSSHNEVFMKKVWNDVLTEEFAKQGILNQRTLEYLDTEQEGNLNLSRVYVLTSRNTASASELIINGLNPYMNVLCIGDRTHGKYVGSVTITDGNNKQAWSVQPIVFKSLNAKGETDYLNGLEPTISIYDDYQYDLGEKEESLLKAAIEHMHGRQVFSSKKEGVREVDLFEESHYNMYDSSVGFEISD